MSHRNNTARTQMFNRILKVEKAVDVEGSQSAPIKPNPMITKVTVRPNPFYTVLTLDVYCEQNRNIIVRMFNEDGRIVKMFSWYLVKGTNVTAINELNNLENGMFLLDIIDNEGNVLYTNKLTKE
jgi:hypothetical protein